VAANALGLQDGFSWKSVAASALTAGIGNGIGLNGAAWSKDATLNLMAKAAVSNAMTQGVNVALGLQEHFNWAAVAASALAAPVAQGIGKAAGSVAGLAIGEGAGKMVGRTVEGITRQAVVKGFSGGRFNLVEATVDAFGNALGQGIVDEMNKPTQGTGPWSKRGYRNGADVESDRAHERNRAEGETASSSYMGGEAWFGNALGEELVDSLNTPSVPPVVSADEKASILKMFEDGPGGTDAVQALRMPRMPSMREMMDLEEVTLTAGPGYKRSPTERFIEGFSGVLASKQTGREGFGIPALSADQQAVADQTYLDSMGELKDVIDYTSKNPTLRDALLRRYNDWVSEGGLAKPPIVQNVATAFGALIGDSPTPEAAIALSVALGTANGIRSNPAAMGGLLGMLALRNETDRVMANLNTMATSTVEYDGQTYNSFQFGGTKANVMELAGALAYPVSGLATRGATLGMRVVMAAGNAIVGGINYLAQATLYAPSIRAAIFSVALRTAEVTNMPAPVPGVGIYSSLRSVASAPSVEPVTSTAAANTTRAGVVRTNAADMRALRDLWDDLGYGKILSDANRAAIAKGLRPKVDEAWIKVFPEDAGLLGERISPHHIAGLPVTVPLPATRHLNAHMPGGFRYNPGGPGAAVPFYPAKEKVPGQ
jgi:hypothetical protein